MVTHLGILLLLQDFLHRHRVLQDSILLIGFREVVAEALRQVDFLKHLRDLLHGVHLHHFCSLRGHIQAFRRLLPERDRC